MCERKLIGCVCAENAASMLAWADYYNAQKLLDVCRRFISDTLDRAITGIDEFQQLRIPDPGLVDELCSNDAPRP